MKYKTKKPYKSHEYCWKYEVGHPVPGSRYSRHVTVLHSELAAYLLALRNAGVHHFEVRRYEERS